MSSGQGYPDWQKITQWIGGALVSQTGLALGAGTHDDGPYNLSSWASVIVAIKPTGGTVTVTVKQTVRGGPPGLELDTSFVVQAGTTIFESVVLSSDVVSLHLQGGGAGVTVDYALIPSNTTINAATVSGGTTPTGAILPFAGAVAPSGYVLCDGGLYDGTSAAYAALWALIGLTYGGTSQASFAVPDLRGRVPVGMGTNAAVNARGLTDGVAIANRAGLRHRHTPHLHLWPNGGFMYENVGAGASGITQSNRGLNNPTDTGTASADGGSGVATDPLDGGGFVVTNYIIAL